MADTLEDLEVAPDPLPRHSCHGTSSSRAPQGFKCPELIDQRLVGRTVHRVNEAPVHWCAVEDGVRNLEKHGFLAHAFISSARRNSARPAALRAASAVGLPSISARSANEYSISTRPMMSSRSCGSSRASAAT